MRIRIGAALRPRPPHPRWTSRPRSRPFGTSAGSRTYKVSFTGPKGKKIEDHGNYVSVWKKVDGQWKVLADINSSEVPGAM
jgi:hypothetical protein